MESAALFPPSPVLVVDDQDYALAICEGVLRSAGITNVVCCQDSRGVLPLLGEQPVELLLLDLSMPHLSGQEVLGQVAEAYPDIPVIIITSANEVETAVECMRLGASDYLVKPMEAGRLLAAVRRAIEVRELRRENVLLRQHMLSEHIEHPEAFAAIITQNGAMRAIFRYVETIARTTRPVLVTGETGVGKELIARALHVLSGRTGNVAAVNAGGLDDNVFSDTLFGHVRGAFTGADRDRKGLIEQAAAGTLFLDEIGDLAPASQVKLLRLLQEHEYFPLGADRPKRSDARIVVATNRDLEALQNDAQFRRDLFHRLQSHHVHVPPLRERLDDLPLLIDHFLGESARALGKRKPHVPREIAALLGAYAFPGNVRELESMIFDALSKHEGRTLSLDVFRARVGRAAASTAPEPSAAGARETLYRNLDALPTIRQATEQLIAEAMKRSGDNQTVAAQMLGLSRSALNKRLKKA